MKKSLFSRYFYMCTGIILLSTLLLGIILLAFTAQFFRGDTFSLLTRNSQNATNLTLNNYRENGYLIIDSREVSSGYAILSNAIDADIMFVDHYGRVLLCDECSEGQLCQHPEQRIPMSIISQANAENTYQEVTTLGGVYDKPHYTVAQPAIIEDSIIGYIFVAKSDKGMYDLLLNIFRTFMIGAVFVLLVTFVVVYFLTESLVRPLRQMADAAASFAKGDFTARIPVGGEDEVDKLAMAFNNMATSLSELELTRRSFVANVSHELKTPMTTIGGFIDGMVDGTIPPDGRDYYLRLVSGEVKRLSRLVVSMLGIAKIEAGEMKFQPQQVDANDVVCRTIFTFERQIEEKEIEILGLSADKVMVEADPDLLHQICYNLMENAVKFTEQKGKIEVSYQLQGKMVNISIKNTGEGIAKEEIPRLFDRFYKTDKSRSIDKNGVGLGLYIVKTLVHIQGGEIMVRSVFGEYSEFVISMPMGQQKSSQNIFRKSPPPSGTKPREVKELKDSEEKNNE